MDKQGWALLPSLGSLPEELLPDVRIRFPVKPNKLFIMDMDILLISDEGFLPPNFQIGTNFGFQFQRFTDLLKSIHKCQVKNEVKC